MVQCSGGGGDIVLKIVHARHSGSVFLILLHYSARIKYVCKFVVVLDFLVRGCDVPGACILFFPRRIHL